MEYGMWVESGEGTHHLPWLLPGDGQTGPALIVTITLTLRTASDTHLFPGPHLSGDQLLGVIIEL